MKAFKALVLSQLVLVSVFAVSGARAGSINNGLTPMQKCQLSVKIQNSSEQAKGSHYRFRCEQKNGHVYSVRYYVK